MELVTDFIFLGSKITDFGSVTAAMKLKDMFLGRKVVKNPDSLLKSRDKKKKQRHHFADKGPDGQSNGFTSSHVQM